MFKHLKESEYLPVIDMKATGRNIERLRRDAGMSVKDLQMFFGFTTPQAIYKWQSGRALPALDNLLALSRLLGISVERIVVCRENERKGGDCHGPDTGTEQYAVDA